MSVPAVVFIRPRPKSLSPAAIEQANAFVAAVAKAFEPPAQLEAPIRVVLPISQFGNPPDSILYPWGGPAFLPIDGAGRLVGEPEAASAIPALNAAIVAAVRRRDSLGPLPTADWLAHTPGGPLRVEVMVAAGLPDRAIPLMATRISVYKADSDASPIDFARPRYPTGSQQRNETAAVEVRYPVTEKGKVDRTAIEVIHVEIDADRPAADVARGFAQSTIDAIARSRFRAAVVRGCPVPTLVHQKVSFRIGGR